MGQNISNIQIVSIKNWLSTNIVQVIVLTSLTTICLRYILSNVSKQVEISKNKIIFITGCDSGLGFSLALHSCELGFTVFAGCLNENSEGSIILKNFSDKLFVIQLDVTKKESIQNSLETVSIYLSTHENYELWTLVNNAGVMVFGEFEWQTDDLIRRQLDVNVFGTMAFTKSFLPLLRKGSSRIITITSHCVTETLPGLAVYGATKSAISSWSDGLRVELNKYGIGVATIIPGSFITQSNIMSKANEDLKEMEAGFDEEQMNFYGEYFREYNLYLSYLSGVKTPKKVDDRNLYRIFEKALTENTPKRCYTNEPWRYWWYHTLFKISPIRLRDYLVVKFMQMPKWNRKNMLNNRLKTVE